MSFCWCSSADVRLLWSLFAFFSKRNEDEEASEKLYTHVTHVNVPTFKGLKTAAVKDE